MSYFQSNEDGAENISPPQKVVVTDGVLALAAGSDTTANALNHMFYHLLSSPDIYRRLQQEVNRFYPASGDSLDPTHHGKMDYLNAVM